MKPYQITYFKKLGELAMHDFLQEIYFDYCQKHDLPKIGEIGKEVYLSADDYLASDLLLTEDVTSWLKNFITLWEKEV